MHAPRLANAGALGVLALALAFPVGLMVLNPTLMFERGWEQYVGTTFYIAAVIMLAREMFRLRGGDGAFASAPGWLAEPASTAARIDPEDERPLAARLRTLASEAGRGASRDELMEINRESSALDQEHAAGRLTLPRYILYLLPVIGFIGTVRGISEALANIGPVLKEMKNLDGFLANLTNVTSALQIAFDSTLLALFLGAALMFAATVVNRRIEDHLARIDRWIVERALPALAGRSITTAEAIADALRPELDGLRRALNGAELASQVERFATSLDQLTPAFAQFDRGAGAIAGLEGQMEAMVKGVRDIEARMREAGAAFEKSGQESQRQLAHTLSSLKDALDLLQVSIEQSNALYRSIVKRMFSERERSESADGFKVA